MPETQPGAQKSFFPIAEITPYHKNWTIQARLVSKSQIRKYEQKQGGLNKAGGAGQVFSVDLVDNQGVEIRASFFNDAVEKHGPKLEEGKVYTFSKGTAKVANRAYNQCAHEYELAFGSDAVVQESEDDGSITNEVVYSFSSIKALKTRPVPCNVDIVGIVTEVSEVRSWKKDEKAYTKYSFVIADESEHSIDVSIFGENIEKYPAEGMKGNPVVAIKGVKLSEFAGRSAVVNNGTIQVNPGLSSNKENNERYQRLKNWWQHGGSKKEFHALTEQLGALSGTGNKTKIVTVAELMEEIEPTATEAEPQYVEMYTRLGLIVQNKKGEKLDLWYEACAAEVERDVPASIKSQLGSQKQLCNKKVIAPGQCPEHGYVKTHKRWMCRVILMDHTDRVWINAFDSELQALTGMTADAAAKMGEEALNEHFQSLTNNRLFKVR